MSKLDITIAGEINLDLILYGLPEQMPTERELLASGFAITLGSSSAILAHNLAALGSRVGFVTKVGDDSFGALALERLRERGVDLAASRMAPSPASRSFCRTDPSATSLRIRAPSPSCASRISTSIIWHRRATFICRRCFCSVNCCRVCQNFFGG
jgi:sugar/nucleoside kinase (ribokinase family)